MSLSSLKQDSIENGSESGNNDNNQASSSMPNMANIDTQSQLSVSESVSDSVTTQLEKMPAVHSAYAKYKEIKNLEPSNATQLVKFCKQHGIPNVKYSQASKYFRVKQGSASDSLSPHSMPPKMYSKYYKGGNSRRTSFTTGVTKSRLETRLTQPDLAKHRRSEPYPSKNLSDSAQGVNNINVDLESMVDNYNNEINNDNSPTTPSEWNDLTKEEKSEIRQQQTKFHKQLTKKRESVYLAMAANATDLQVEEVYDDVDAAEEAAIKNIQENVQAAFKALVGSMKSHGNRLTQSKEQLQVIDEQMDAAKQLIVKEFDVAMGTLLKRRNGLLKALEVAHEENTKILQEQIKEQQSASNKLITCKDKCKEYIKDQKTKEAVEAVVQVLNDVRPSKPELASINLQYKQSDTKLNDFLDNYGTVSVAKTVRSLKGKKEANGNGDGDDSKEE